MNFIVFLALSRSLNAQGKEEKVSLGIAENTESDETTKNQETLSFYSIIKDFFYYALVHGGDYNKYFNRTISKDEIKSRFFPNFNDFDKRWSQLTSGFDVLNAKLRLLIIFKNTDIKTETIAAFADKIHGFLKNPLNMKIVDLINDTNNSALTKSIISDVLSNWTNVKEGIKMLNINDDAFKRGLQVMNEEFDNITIQRMLSGFSISTGSYERFADVLRYTIKKKLVAIKDFLDLFGISHQSFNDIADNISIVFEDKEITPKSLNDVSVAVLSFILETAGCIIKTAADIVNTSIRSFFTSESFSFKQRVSGITTALNAFEDILKKNKVDVPYWFEETCKLLNQFLEEGIDIYPILEKFKVAELGKEILEIIQRALNGEENIYGVYNSFASLVNENHLIKRLFMSSSLNQLVESLYSINDPVIQLLRTGLHLTNASLGFDNLPLFSSSLFNSIDFAFLGEFSNIIKEINNSLELSKNLKELFKAYDNDDVLINPDFRKVFDSGMKSFAKLLNEMKRLMEEGNSIENSLLGSLKSVSSNEFKDFFTYIMDEMSESIQNQSTHAAFEVQKILKTIKDNFENSGTLYFFLNRISEIDTTELKSILKMNREDVEPILLAFPIQKIIANLTSNGLFNIIFNQIGTNDINSEAEFVLSMIKANAVKMLRENMKYIDYVITFLINGTIEVKNKEELSFYKDTISYLKRLSKAFNSENAAQFICEFDFNPVNNILKTVKKNMAAYNNGYHSLIFHAVEPAMKLFDIFIKGFSGKEITELISDESDPRSIAKLIDLFCEYADPLINGESLFPVIKKQLDVDIETIISPVKNTLETIHLFISETGSNSNVVRSISKAINELNKDKNDMKKRLFEIFDISILSSSCEALNSIIAFFEDKKLYKLNADEVKSDVSELANIVNTINSVLGEKCSFRALINNCAFNNLFVKMSGKRADDDSWLSLINKAKESDFSIQKTLENLLNLKVISIYGVTNSFTESKTSKSVVSLYDNLDAAGDKITIQVISTKANCNVVELANSIKRSKVTLVSRFPDNSTFFCRKNFALVGEIANNIENKSFNISSAEIISNKYIANMKGEEYDPYKTTTSTFTLSASSKKLSIILPIAIVIFVLVVLALIYLIFKSKKSYKEMLEDENDAEESPLIEQSANFI